MNAFDLTLNATEFPLHTPADSFKVKVSGTDAGEAADTLNAGEIPLNKNDMERKEENILLPHKFFRFFFIYDLLHIKIPYYLWFYFMKKIV